MFKWLLILIIYLPVQIALSPLLGIDLASIRIFIVVFFCFWLVSNFLRKKTKLSFNLIFLCLGVFLLISLISVIFAQDHIVALKRFVLLGSVFPLYLLTADLVDQAAKARKIVRAFIFSAGFVALIGLIQFVSQFFVNFEKVIYFWFLNIMPVFSGAKSSQLMLNYPTWLVNIDGHIWLRAVSVFSDGHILAFCLGMILPLGAVLCLSASKYKQILIIINYLLFIVLLLTFARGAYLAVIFSFSAMIWFLWRHFKRPKAALAISLCFLLFIIPKTPINQRFFSILNFKEQAIAERFDLWKEAGQIGGKSPLFGIGAGNFSIQQKQTQDVLKKTAHNLYLDIFSELGIAGLAIWLVLIFSAIYKLYKKMTAVSTGDKQALFCLGLICSLCYYAVHSFFETVYHPVILGILMVILGLSHFYGQKNSNN